MNANGLAAILAATALIDCSAFAQEAAPKFPLSKAAKLAEDAIAAASLPADCYLRSISLVEKPDVPAYFRATYKPPVTRRVRVNAEPSPIILEFIRISMDGKVSFEQEEMNPPRRIISRDAK